MAEVITETCANCGRVIGRLETPAVWGEHVVCGECYRRLNPPVSQPKATADPLQQLSQAVHSPAHRMHRRHEYHDFMRFYRGFFFWPALGLIAAFVLAGILNINRPYDQPPHPFVIIFDQYIFLYLDLFLWIVWFILKIVSMIQRAAWLQKVDDGF